MTLVHSHSYNGKISNAENASKAIHFGKHMRSNCFNDNANNTYIFQTIHFLNHLQVSIFFSGNQSHNYEDHKAVTSCLIHKYLI